MSLLLAAIVSLDLTKYRSACVVKVRCHVTNLFTNTKHREECDIFEFELNVVKFLNVNVVVEP